MSGGRERIDPDVVRAVEQAAILRITVPTDKDLMKQFGISRASIQRIMLAARRRLRSSMRQLSQSEK